MPDNKETPKKSNHGLQENNFGGGLNLDHALEVVQPNQYRDSLNYRVKDLGGNTFEFINLQGTKKLLILPYKPGDTEARVVGWKDFSNLLFILYSDGQNRHGIGVYIQDSIKSYVIQKEIVPGALSALNWVPVTQADVDNQRTTDQIICLVESTCLNFSFLHPTLREMRVEPVYDGSLNLYWTDNFNEPKKWNTNTKYFDCNQFFLYSKFRMPVIRSPFPVEDFIISGGNLPVGGYRVAVRYLDENFNTTDWSYLSDLVSIVDATNKAEWWKYDGSQPNAVSGKAFQLDLSNLDTVYSFIQLGVVQYSGAGIDGFLTDRIPFTTDTIRVRVDGTFIGDLDTAELGIDRIRYTTAKTLEIINNRLFLGNLFSTEQNPPLFQRIADSLVFQVQVDNSQRPNYEKITRNILTEAVDLGFVPDTAGWGHYQNEWMIFNKVGYFSDNSYGFGIQFVLKDGTKSPLFPIGQWYVNNPYAPATQAIWDRLLPPFPTSGQPASYYFDPINLLLRFHELAFVDSDLATGVHDLLIKYLTVQFDQVDPVDIIEFQSICEGYAIYRTDRYGDKTVASGLMTESFTNCAYDEPLLGVSGLNFECLTNHGPLVLNIYKYPTAIPTFPGWGTTGFENKLRSGKVWNEAGNTTCESTPEIDDIRFFSPILNHKTVEINGSSYFRRLYPTMFNCTSQFSLRGVDIPTTNLWTGVAWFSNPDNDPPDTQYLCTATIKDNTDVRQFSRPCHIFNNYLQALVPSINIDYLASNINQSGYFEEQTQVSSYRFPAAFDSAINRTGNFLSYATYARFCSTVTANLETTIPISLFPFLSNLVTFVLPKRVVDRDYYLCQYIPLNDLNAFNYPIYSGDNFITNPFYRFLTKENAGDGVSNNNEEPNPAFLFSNPSFVFFCGVWNESEYNLNFRNTIEPDAENDSFYFPYSEHFNELGWYAYTNNYTEEGHTPRETTESLEYNQGYNAINTQQVQRPIQPGQKFINRLPTRIAYSDQKAQDSIVDTYKNFGALSYKDEDLVFGAITRIVRHINQLLCVQEQSIVLLGVSQPVTFLDNATGTFKLGQPEVLPPRGVYLSQEYGSQHIYSIDNSEQMVYGVDVRKKVLWQLQQDKFTLLSKSKLVDSLINAYLTKYPEFIQYDEALYQTPNYLIGTHYDYLMNEVYFTFNFNKEGRIDNFCLLFGEYIDAFCGYVFGKGNILDSSGIESQLFVPQVYMRLGNRSFAMTPLDIENQPYVYGQDTIQELNKGRKNQFFLLNGDNGHTLPSTFTFVINSQWQLIKIFNNLRFNFDIETEDGIVCNDLNGNTLFIYCENTFQKTEISRLLLGSLDDTNLRRVERRWQTFIPREDVAEEWQPRMRDYFCKVQLTFNTANGDEIRWREIISFFLLSER